ncbi:amidohydrolase family protein [Streptomyces sp. NRRL B-1347]|uniref:amidohydrolase family protein n=1 Tax=Streptomyces sp. NRRL B-1347 TaxID=1476877 RepID=UPI00068A8D72|nr:amidohydrolase family protein [Streptomyces sp. NRRL B-1347]
MRTTIRGAHVFDGERALGAADVVLEDGLITAVGAAPDGTADVEVDGRGGTLLPGLIDAHTHVFDGSLAEALRYGVTTEFDMFCLPRPLARHRRLADQHDDVADLRSAGTIATAPGGHPTQLLAALTGTVLDPSEVTEIDHVTDPAQAGAFVKARLAEGADYLKLVLDDGAVHGTDLPRLTPAVATALTAAAHEVGLLVIAHAITAAEVDLALDAGADGLAHVWADLPPEDRDSRRLAERIRARGVFVVTTLAYFEALSAQRPGATVCSHPGHYANAVGALRALHRAGVPLLTGTDATPFAPAHGVGLHRELQLLTEAGLGAEQALAAATAVPARHFGLTDRGRVAPGLRADLLLVEGDPTRDVAALGSLTAVWRRGVRHDAGSLASGGV